jgi:putative sigma-54 modulation protein
VDLAEEKKSKSPDQHIAQITLRHQRGTILRAEERTGDIFAAVDGVVDKLYRQIEKYKGRRRKKGENVDQFSAIETAVELPAEDFETGKIIRRKTFSAVPMHEEEAIEQMELLGHDFFVFVSGASGNVNVLYRRNDGNLGILVPEVQ